MTIRSKLTGLFTLLFAALLLAFAVFIYASSAETREEEYFRRLSQQAVTKARLIFDASVDPQVLQLIYKNAPNALFEEEVAIYDTGFHLLYHDAVQIDKIKETSAMISEIVQQREIRFTQGSMQAVGLLYHHKGANYVITAAAIDDYGFAKLKDLRNTLIAASSLMILITVFIGYFFARKALRPVADIVDKVNDITATNLDLRVPVKNEKDEIGELAATFNNMLNRLENSFDAQKSFVSNVSHELRTPLAAIIAELELAGNKDRSSDEYRAVINRTMDDARRLVKLSNGLLDMAKASYDQSGISMKPVRPDELLLEAREAVLATNPAFRVNIDFEQSADNDDPASLRGNEYLLKVAFINLIENACKFSPDQLCNVLIAQNEQQVVVRFADNGPGIAETESGSIFQPFFRGKNHQLAEGHGIGLSLTQKIVHLHDGDIQFTSPATGGTIFTLQFRRL